MYCRYCGKEIGDNAKKCPFCGEPVWEADDIHITPGAVIAVLLVVLIGLIVVAYCGGLEMWIDVTDFFN